MFCSPYIYSIVMKDAKLFFHVVEYNYTLSLSFCSSFSWSGLRPLVVCSLGVLFSLMSSLVLYSVISCSVSIAL